MDNNGERLPTDIDQDGSVKGPVDLNISDILDAICIADPAFDVRSVSAAARTSNPATAASAMPTMATKPLASPAPYVQIVEQPASKALRFRYECEGRSAGSIPGVNSTSERKTYPTIEIRNCTGSAIVVVSCVTKDAPYKPHPHNLVGRERCDRGVCTVRAELANGAGAGTLVAFSNLGIQCVKRKDIDGALRTREELRVDPFKTGFGHRSQPQSIDLNAVRLCFQVFVTGDKGKVRLALPPVVSEVIYDKKAMSDLHISRISHCSGPVRGRMTMILLCEKVSRDDTAVVFFERGEGGVVWEAAATNVHVHKQAAIAFDTPPYRDPETTANVKVFLQLKRTTDNARSNALDFEYTVPPDVINAKRKKPVSPFAQNSPYPVEMGNQIKCEPKESPNYVRSPQHVYPPYDLESVQRWPLDMPQPVAGPSQVPFSQGLWTEQGYHMAHMAPLSPLSQQQVHMGMGHVSPGMAHPATMGHPTPGMGHMSPSMSHASPVMGHVSPGMGQMSPSLSHASPAMVHPQTQYVQNMGQQSMIQDLDATTNSTPSLSKLLEVQGQGEMPMSGDLSFPLYGADLSDSLRALSTKDLLDNSQWPPHGGG